MEMRTWLLETQGPDRRSRPREDRPVTHVLLHFMSNVVQNPKDPYNIDQVRDIFVQNEMSAHYIIDRQGGLIKLVEEDRIAWHAGKGSLPDYPQYKNRLNSHSIGIEFLAMGSKKEMAPKYMTETAYDNLNPDWSGFTNAQYETANQLLAQILQRHPTIPPNRRHIIGHDEYAGPAGRPDNPKVDPGELFDWTRVKLD